MARFNYSILGEATGNAGRANFYRWRGKQFVRGRMIERGNANATAAQLSVQQRFAVLSEFLKKVPTALRLGFVKVSDGKTYMNVAFSANWGTVALSGDTWTLTPSDMVLSNGTDDFAIKAVKSTSSVDFSWKAPRKGDAYYTDGQLVAVAYNKKNAKVIVLLADLSAASISLDSSSIATGADDEIFYWYFASTGIISSPSQFLE